jgi:hypothetical protein
MPYTVQVDHPEAGDQDIYIHGLGTFRNGTETEVSDEQAELYRVLNATQNQEHTEDGGLIVESVLAPPIDELDIRGVTITEVRDRPPRAKAPAPKGDDE